MFGDREVTDVSPCIEHLIKVTRSKNLDTLADKLKKVVFDGISSDPATD